MFGLGSQTRARPWFEGGRRSQLLREALTALPMGSLPGLFLFPVLQGLLFSGSGNERCPLNRCQAPRPTQEHLFLFSLPCSRPLAPLNPHPEARAIRNHCWSPRTGCPKHIAEYLQEKNDLEAGVAQLLWREHENGSTSEETGCSRTGWPGSACSQVPSMPRLGEGHIGPGLALYGFA